MRSKKKSNTVKWGNPIKVDKNMPSFADDPVVIRKTEEMEKALKKNPPPEWILKRMRGEG